MPWRPRSEIMRKMPLRLIFALACAGQLTAAVEFRGVWVARESLATRERLRETLVNLADANFNAVFINCWSRGYPLWPSDVFERETGLKIDPAFIGRDVLAEAIEEAKPLGIAVFPWFEYGFAGGYSEYFPGEGKRGLIFDRHPDWLAMTRDGTSQFLIGGTTNQYFYWMSHTHPDAQRFLLDLVVEVIRRYKVPGVEFDRARYPQLDCGYDPATKDLYAKENDGRQPPDNPADAQWMRWRANKLNQFLAELNRQTKTADWRGLMTNAPVVFDFSYRNFMQEYPAWVRERSLDFVSPQVYRATVADFEAELDRQMAHLGDVSRLVPGIDITNSRSAENLAEQIQAVRKRKLPGFVVWFYGGLTANNALGPLKAGVLAEKAELPFRLE